MRVRFYAFWEQLSASFWFLPVLMVLAAMLLAQIMVAVDHTWTPSENPLFFWVYESSPDGARTLLSTIAGSMMSVAGITFSITLTTLSLVSSQLGSHLLDNFMRDWRNQVSLGAFVAIFIYCVLVLRVVRGSEDTVFVPHLAVTLALGLAVVGLGVLIYFFHHVSTMIQARNVVISVGQELETSIDTLYTLPRGKSRYAYELRRADDIPADFDDRAAYLTAPGSGYLQAIDYEELVEVAAREGLLLRWLYRPGDFIARRSEIVAVYPPEALTDAAQEAICDTFSLGTMRLRTQDVEFAVHQLVEIALRALSPGINDPYTAIDCLDQFSTALTTLAEKRIPSGYYYDRRGALRVISNPASFEGIINAAFNQIRQHCASHVAVTIRLLEVIAIVLARAETDDQRAALLRQVEMIKRASDANVPEENDRRDINARYEQIMQMVNGGQTIPPVTR